MSRERFKQVDSLLVVRHAQRCDKVAQTTSSINFHHNNGGVTQDLDSFMLSDSYNPRLATFETTDNKSNNGYIQSMELAFRIMRYLQQSHQDKDEIILNFHSSPYLRCLETIKFIIDFLIRKHSTTQNIRIVISIDQFLSEWLNTELDMNYFPPNDNGETLLTRAIQYLNAHLSYNHKNPLIKIEFDLAHDSYQNGNPGVFSESFPQHFQRMNNGLISVLKNESSKRSSRQSNIMVLVTHGACVRSLISKLLNKPIYIEIPLVSLSIAEPVREEEKQSIWKLVSTDIEIKEMNKRFTEVNLYKKDNPFKNFQLNRLVNSHLTFKSVDALPPKKESYFRIPEKFIQRHNSDIEDSDSESDSDSDSDSEGLSFRVPIQRRPKSQSPPLERTLENSNQKRFRSASLFGPTLKNPFFNEHQNSIDSQLERTSSFEKYQFERYSPKDQVIDSNYDDNNNNNNNNNDNNISTTATNPAGQTQQEAETARIYRNIDIDDGNYCYGSPPYQPQRRGRPKANSVSSTASNNVPELDEMYSSNNSSSNSLHETLTNNTIEEDEVSTQPTQTSPDSSSASSNNVSSTNSGELYQNEELNDSSITIKQYQQQQAKPDSIQNKPSAVLFDKSLIENSLKEITQQQDHGEDEEEDEEDSLGFLPFGSGFSKSSTSNINTTGATTSTSGGQKSPSPFKIELYERKNRFKLNLYNDNDEDDYDNGSSGSWFMGSNKY